jgi:hypothetical protein
MQSQRSGGLGAAHDPLLPLVAGDNGNVAIGALFGTIPPVVDRTPPIAHFVTRSSPLLRARHEAAIVGQWNMRFVDGNSRRHYG